MSGIEVVATICGLLCVILTARQHILCWPFGLVQVALYVVLFWEAKLYADVGLQVVYIGLQLWGWWSWLGGGPRHQDELPVRGLSARGRVVALGVIALLTGVIGYSTATWTDASLPWPDAFITAASLVAQTLLGRKVWESWVGWIAVDVVAVPVYWSKDLPLTAGLYAVFLGLALSGLLAWRRSLAAASSSANSSLRTADISSS